MRYIKVEDAIKVADYGCGEFRGIFGQIKEQLDAIPTADVVEVVRCKECIYNQGYFTNYLVKCGCGNGAHHEGFFCADGERRTDDDRT